MASHQEEKKDEFLGFGIAIVFIVAGFVMFFGWENFGNEMLFKIIATPIVVCGIAFAGLEISSKTGDSSAGDLGIGSAIIIGGMMVGAINFPFSLNILVLILVSLGSIFVISSIFALAKNKNPNLSFVYRLIMVIGQICTSLLAIIKFVQFFIGIFN